MPFRSSFARSGATAVLVTLLGILPIALLLWSGRLPATQESARYLVLADHFRAAFASGAWYPRWLPYLNGGFGYPTFIFYQPAYFYLNLLFSVLQQHPLEQMLLTIVAITQLGAIGVYLLLRQYCNRQTSILGLLLFVMTPYLYVNLYVRGDLSEYLAMMLMPWPVYFLLRLKAACAINHSPTALIAVGLPLSLSFTILAHPVTLLFFFPAFCLLAVALWLELKKSGRSCFFLESLIGVLFALALSAPYWATVLTMRPFALVDNATFINPMAQAVAVTQLFSRFYGFGNSVPGLSDGMSFQLGLPHFLLALAGAWVGRRRWLIFGSFVCYAALVLMMTRFGPWAWNTPWRFAQFPWRALSALALFQVMSITGLDLLRTHLRTMLIVIGVAIVWYLPVFQIQPGPNYTLADLKKDNDQAMSLPLTLKSAFAELGEWTPVKSAKLYMTEPTSAIISVPHTANAKPLGDHTRYHLHYLVTLGSAGTVIVNQIYFPGWRIELDGKAMPQDEIARSLLEDGRMAISVPAGTHELRARYDGPLEWQKSAAIALTGFVIWLIFRLARRRDQRGRAARVTLSGGVAGQAHRLKAIFPLLLTVCIGLVLVRARDSGDINIEHTVPLQYQPWDRPLTFKTGFRDDGVFWSVTGDGLDGARLFVSSRPGILSELPLAGRMLGRPVDPGAPLNVMVVAPDNRKVKFAEFNFATSDEEVRADVMTFHEVNGKLATVQAGDCSIDSMNITKGGYQRHRTLDLSGTVRPAGKHILESSIEVLLSGTQKPHKFMAHGVRVNREDDAIDLSIYDNVHASGFVLRGADISMLPGDTYQVSIVQRLKGTEIACDSGVVLSVD